MYSRIMSAVSVGIEGREVYVETDISKGLPNISVVGLAQTTVMESKERIKSAIINSGFAYPRTRITINLMPAELKKNSSSLDLPMALGILCSEMGVEDERINEYAIIGELTLDGRVNYVRGALPMLMRIKECGISKVVIAEDNAEEAMLAGIKEIYPVANLMESMNVIINPETARKADKNAASSLSASAQASDQGDKLPIGLDFSDISGQENAKRAVLVATAGRHGLLMVGSPGCGKTMLAGRIAGIMPAMDEQELIRTAMIRSIAGIGKGKALANPARPFRHPHHTIGPAGLLGGGSMVALPGEISLAHNGVLFLDEICEFNKHVIDGLRIPLEEKSISHFRKGEVYTYPCDFQLVMASNPCPCGYYGDKEKECRCTQADIERYQSKLSGPIMDRIDMKISMERVTYKQLTSKEEGMSSEYMRTAVIKAREFALSSGRKGYNCDLTAADAEKHCRMGEKEKGFMRDAYTALAMSPRAYMRTLRVARTIADLDESTDIKQEHLAEALSYRMP